MPFPCNQCQAVTINGIPCHETGCPEAWRDESIECFECGCDFERTERHQTVCLDCLGHPDSSEYDDNPHATKQSLQAWLDAPENEEQLRCERFERMELPLPGDFDVAPYWLAEGRAAYFHARSNVRTTAQYHHGDIADSTGEDWHPGVPGRADRLRQRALRYIDGAEKAGQELWCSTSEGYWTQFKVGQVVKSGPHVFLCVGSVESLSEEEEYQADDGTFAYAYHGPAAVYLFVLLSE